MSALAHPRKPRNEPTRDCDWQWINVPGLGGPGGAAPRIMPVLVTEIFRCPMSALGHKRRFAVQLAMSAGRTDDGPESVALLTSCHTAESLDLPPLLKPGAPERIRTADPQIRSLKICH
jgi:hypothetical protein